MREAARVLDDVSDHLGEVLRRSYELLAEWSRFGAQVRTQVDRETAGIGEVIDGAVARAASAGIDRAIADRLRALTAEIERLEQRTRAAARAASEQREGDRRVLWIVVAGIVLANALLVALLLRKPEAAPVVEPIRLESTDAPQSPPGSQGLVPGGSVDPSGASSAPSAPGASSAPSASSATAAGSAAGVSDAPGAGAGSGAAIAGGSAGPAAPGAKPGGGATPNAATKPAGPDGTAKSPEAAGSAKGAPAPIALPPKGGPPRPHKKLP